LLTSRHAVNGQDISESLSVAGFCDTCAEGVFEFSPALLRAMGGDGTSPITGQFVVGL
jgi:hypothetical protein